MHGTRAEVASQGQTPVTQRSVCAKYTLVKIETKTEAGETPLGLEVIWEREVAPPRVSRTWLSRGGRFVPTGICKV